MEVIAGSGETGTPWTPRTNASADQVDSMTRQGSAAVSPRGDSPTDQANLVRDLIREELRRGLGRCSRRSEREAPWPHSRRRVLVLVGHTMGKRSW